MVSTPPAALSVLSAMITPAVLISACASLILITSSRLVRAVDRTLEGSRRFAALASGEAEAGADLEEERSMLFRQLDLNTSRCRLLQRALAQLYAAVGVFVGTSLAIGIVAVIGRQYTWLPVGFGLVGAGLLLWASALLVRESRIALVALEGEMDFLWKRGRSHASPEMLAAVGRSSGWVPWNAKRRA